MPFIKGQTANPTGKNGQKPVSDALKAMLSRDPNESLEQSSFRTNAQLLAYNIIVKALAGCKDSIKEVLDRTEGRPPQSLEHSGNVTLTHEEVLAQLDNDAE